MKNAPTPVCQCAISDVNGITKIMDVYAAPKWSRNEFMCCIPSKHHGTKMLSHIKYDSKFNFEILKVY